MMACNARVTILLASRSMLIVFEVALVMQVLNDEAKQ